MKVAITGTPGTGKSTLARSLANKGYVHLDLNKAIKTKKLFSGYDRKRKSYIADQKKVTAYVRKFLKGKKNVVIDGHLSHVLPSSMVDIVIVLRCEPKELIKRLRKKRWNMLKAQENAESEFLNMIAEEARKKHKKVYDIDTTGKKKKQILKDAEIVLKRLKSSEKYKVMINWMI